MDTTARARHALDQANGEPVIARLPEAPRRWIDAGRGRLRAQVAARLRHPISTAHSALTRRPGITNPIGVPVSTDQVLERVGVLPLSVWTYGFDHHSVRHLGPMAQDFAAAFGLGSTNRRINAVDANGVCLASIQALHRRVVALEQDLSDLAVKANRDTND